MVMEWPKIGTVYPSRAAAKVALCRVAIARQESLSTTQSNPAFVWLSCSARGFKQCSFSANLRLIGPAPSSSSSSSTSTSTAAAHTGMWKLDETSCLQHTHSFSSFSKAESDKVKTRLLGLLKKWQAEAQQEQDANGAAGTGIPQKKKPWEDESAVEEEEKVVESPPTATATAGTSQESEQESEYEEHHLFPSYGNEAALIDALVDDTDMILTLPTTKEDIAFDSSYEAAIQLHVASRQAHFTLYVSAAGASQSFAMYCGKGHSQCAPPLCTYRLSIVHQGEATGGRWLASLAGDGEHNHPIGKDAPRPRRLAGTRKNKDVKMGKYRPLTEVANPANPEVANHPDETKEAGTSGTKVKTEVLASPPKKAVASEWSKAPSGTPVGLSFEKINSHKMQELIAETIKEYFEFPMPGSSISYASHEDYRLHLVCAALQRDFSCSIRFSSSNLIRFYCGRGGARGTAGACPWTMEAAKEDGEWRTSRVDGKHNHQIWSDERARAEVERVENEETEGLLNVGGSSSASQKGRAWDRDGEREDSDRPKKKPRTSAYPSPSPSLATDPARANHQLASSATSSHLVLPVKQEYEQAEYKPVIPPPRAPRRHTRLPDQSFLPGLTSFLHTLSSSLVPIAPTLLSLGLDSEAALATLFTLSDNALESVLGSPDRTFQNLIGIKAPKVEGSGSGATEVEGWGEDYERAERKVPLAQSRIFILALKRARGEMMQATA